MTLSSSVVRAFQEHPRGLCGRHDPALSIGQIMDLEPRLNLLTFGVVLDKSFLNQERWSALVDQHDHWTFDPAQVAYQSSAQLGTALQQIGIAIPQPIVRVWWQICRGVQGRYKGSWRDLFKDNHDNAQMLMGYLQKSKTTFPVLSGPFHSAHWLDLIHRIGGVKLEGWESLTVRLSAQQQKSARRLGIESTDVHPSIALTVHVWEDACQTFPKESCGMEDCPRR